MSASSDPLPRRRRVPLPRRELPTLVAIVVLMLGWYLVAHGL